MQIPEQFSKIPLLIGKSIRQRSGAYELADLSTLFSRIATSELEHTAKEDRYFFSQSLTDIRPKLETKYSTWCGVTVVDLDIKDADAAQAVKHELHKALVKQPWYAGIVLSTSHKGCHIYTACKPDNVTQESYLDHLESVSICIWSSLIVLYRNCSIAKTYSNSVLINMHPVLNLSSRKENEDGSVSDSKMFDLATFKLTQPTLLGYDPEPLLNEDFELQPQLGLSENAWEHCLEGDFLKKLFDKRRQRLTNEDLRQIVILDKNLPTIELCTPRNYDNTARYRLAYTLAAIYDCTGKNSPTYDLLMKCFLRMCSGNPKFKAERRAFAAVFDSACVRQSQGMAPIVPWALHELKTVHHVSIETDVPVEQKLTELDVPSELQKEVKIPPELRLRYDRIFQLEPGQYVSDGEQDIMSKLQKPGSKTLLIAEPGTGKTVFVTNMMSKHPEMRILCIAPYISVIESKFKTLDQTAACQCIYGFAKYDPAGPRNVAMTFDKFSKLMPSEIDGNFDLVCLDESHLLQMSLYRGLVPANVIDNIRAIRTPVIMMTGTPIAEHMFIDFTDKILFKRSRATSKLFNCVICNTPSEKFAQACLHIGTAIKAGRRVICPTNEGNSYTNKIVNAVEEVLGRPVTWHYYKKEYNDEAFMFEVNRNGTIQDIELLFCSSYLSVGVDINDVAAFDVVYAEPFTAHEIEQFNNRLRRVDLVSYYFVAKYTGDSTIQPNLLANAPVNLRMTRIRELALQDLIALNTIQVDKDKESSALYDFFTARMQMPYLIRQSDGACRLHATCYSLYTFEEEWRKWALHVQILLYQLREYNYQIDVIDAQLLDNSQLTAVLDSARDGFRLYGAIVADDIDYIAQLIHNQDFYNILVYSNNVKLVRSNELYVRIDNYDRCNLQQVRINVGVKNLQQCWRFIKAIRMLSKYYVRQTILDLYGEAGGKTSKIEHTFNTVRLLDYATNDRLTDANVSAVRYVLYQMFKDKDEAQFSRKQLAIHIRAIVEMYKAAYALSSDDVLERLQAVAYNMICRLAECLTRRRGETTPQDWRLRKIPTFDSSSMQYLDAHKQLMLTMFQASLFVVNKELKTHDEVNRFFKDKEVGEHQKVDVQASIIAFYESLDKLPEAKPRIHESMRQMLIMQATALRPELSTAKIAEIVDNLDTSGNNLYKTLVDTLNKI